jgi:hypothetical protein
MRNRDDEIDYCQWKKCKEPSCIVYLGKGVCEKHWNLIDELSDEKFKRKLGIKIKNISKGA